ncbi:flagellar hook capping protein [Sphingorhabdus sp. IMCC26285]|jgi:flagellar basal-body rod modification protein FlgD|uniref:Basal-body rod modification protein FlgD n=1 Tax=Sphingorhabdus profundilacus TaxID=2509718 RepID=A0A6I4LYN0_9SPHN|nr:flagellar hook capping FlgD N-terminal domain-containing protein [Sphingorhabdus profundilacus]MVZ97989.1 flagellar hook capping protein [Sphingorhabdus profundilacus]
MTSVSAVNSRNLPVLSKDMAEKKLGQNDFLRLMTTQLKEQDPFNPVDNQAMVAQMAQFSSVAGISEMNTSLKSIAEQISAQTALLADIKSSNATATTASATGV